MLLADNGMGQESIVLNRVMLEHTIVLHWIIERGDDGINAMLANQSKQMKKWLDKARATTLEIPQAIAGEITASFDGIDETRAASIFSDMCGQVGCEDLYAGLRDLEPDSPPVGVHEQRLRRSLFRRPPAHATLKPPANVTLVAQCLIWAQRAFDRLLPDPSRAQGLKNLASAIQALPVLPDYQPAAPPQAGTSGGRRSRRGRARSSQSEPEDVSFPRRSR